MIVEFILGALTAIGVTALFVLYKFNSCKNYWPRRGIKVATFPSMFPMGNSINTSFPALFSLANKWDLAQEQVKDLREEKCYGTYGIGWKPVLIVNDPEMVKQFLVKDFNYFVDRKFPLEKFLMKDTFGDKLWLKMVLFASGEEWKDMRSTFSPIFTSGKMKQMAHLINDISVRLIDSLEEDIQCGGVIDLRDKFDRFSLNNIASCAFGIDAQAFSNKSSDFLQNAKGIASRGLKDALKILIAVLPGGRRILKALGTSVMKSNETMFFFELVKAAIDMRKKTKKRRNDLIDLMLDVMKDELNEDDGQDDEDQYDRDAKLSHRKTTKEFDIINLGATALVMLTAGYDTTSQTLAYVGYFLATHPNIQEKLRREVNEVYDENEGNKPPYHKIQEMEYLDMVIHETLRCTNPVPLLSRVCTKDYTMPDKPQVTIKPNDEVYINAAGIHMNPKFYPDPEKFIPERFTKEEKDKRHPYTFLGFGQGPRNCIGMRFALYEAKVGLVTMLRKYKLSKALKTPEKIHFDPKSVLTASLDTLWVKVEHI